MNLAAVLRIHSEHRNADTVEYSDCRECQKQRAICRSKFRFQTGAESRDKALEVNIETNWERMLCSYHCPWCEFYHHTKARPGAQTKRVEKQRRKWLIENQKTEN